MITPNAIHLLLNLDVIIDLLLQFSQPSNQSVVMVGSLVDVLYRSFGIWYKLIVTTRYLKVCCCLCHLLNHFIDDLLGEGYVVHHLDNSEIVLRVIPTFQFFLAKTE